MLGRYEYQKGNVEAALHVFGGIDITSLSPKIKLTLARIGDCRRGHCQNDPAPPMSMRAVSLVFEAMFLKAKSLQSLGKFEGTFLWSVLHLNNTSFTAFCCF